MLSTVADQGECAVCSPPQAVAQVMIQSFQLSSCALFNAQMQDVSVHRPPPPPLSSTLFLSASGPCLDTRDVSNVTGPFVMVLVIYFFIYFAVVLGVQPTRVSMGDVVLSSCAFAVVPPPTPAPLSLFSLCPPTAAAAAACFSLLHQSANV